MDQAAASTSAGTSRVLCRLGVLLILLGLATGAAIPLFDDARRGLAAHTAGVQNGMLLTVLGLLWGRLQLTPALARITAAAGVFSLYAIWLAFVLAAIFGTGAAAPAPVPVRVPTAGRWLRSSGRGLSCCSPHCNRAVDVPGARRQVTSTVRGRAGRRHTEGRTWRSRSPRPGRG
jgi:hypothetical protein